MKGERRKSESDFREKENVKRLTTRSINANPQASAWQRILEVLEIRGWHQWNWRVTLEGDCEITSPPSVHNLLGAHINLSLIEPWIPPCIFPACFWNSDTQSGGNNPFRMPKPTITKGSELQLAPHPSPMPDRTFTRNAVTFQQQSGTTPMPNFSSEPRFEPEPLGLNSEFSSRFRFFAE